MGEDEVTVTSELHAQEYRAIEEEKDQRPELLVGVRKEEKLQEEVVIQAGEGAVQPAESESKEKTVYKNLVLVVTTVGCPSSRFKRKRVT